MRKFSAIMRYEYLSVVKTKTYRIITILAVVLLAAFLFWPALFGSPDGEPAPQSVNKVAVADRTGLYEDLGPLTAALQGHSFFAAGEEDARAMVEKGEADSALIIVSPLECEYVTKSTGMVDEFPSAVKNVMENVYRTNAMQEAGISPGDAQRISSAQAGVKITETGKSFMSTYWYTYIMIFLLYFAVVMYGQLVASSVASEKSTRAMELLITSANTNELMFGKVIGSGLAGLTQLVAIVGSGLVFYGINASAWANNSVVSSIFNMPVHVLVYALAFFVLGFFLYAFLFGALGSLASRTEDINTSIMPVILLLVAAFIITMFGIMDDPNGPLLTVCSFIPFFSPVAMFARICMSDVGALSIIISLFLLVAFNVLIGLLSAKIYRMGVLMYGKPPRLKDVVRAALGK